MATYAYSQPVLPHVLARAATPAMLGTAAILETCEFDQPQWAGQIAKRVSVEQVRLTEPDFTATELREGGWSDTEIVGGQLAGFNLTASSWRRILVRRARLSGAVFIETQLKDVTFEDAKLDLANFRFAKLTRVQFIRCQLTEADFSGGRLTDVQFTDCDLTATDVSGTLMRRVDLRSSTLASIKGIGGLKGGMITSEQMITLLPEFAAALEVIVKND